MLAAARSTAAMNWSSLLTRCSFSASVFCSLGVAGGGVVGDLMLRHRLC